MCTENVYINMTYAESTIFPNRNRQDLIPTYTLLLNIFSDFSCLLHTYIKYNKHNKISHIIALYDYNKLCRY